MTEKKELNNEELEQVAGGYSPDEYLKEYPIIVDKYDTENYKGQEMYFDYTYVDGMYCWIYGTLLDSYEDDNGCGTKRVAKVSVKECGGYVNQKVEVIDLDKWKVHKK